MHKMYELLQEGREADVLVIEDNRDSLRQLEALLKEEGYIVRPMPEGRLGLLAAQTKPPDLILLDIRMPDMDGYEVCKRLKMDERTRNIPIIFISGLEEVAEKVKAFSVGGVDYITKPFHKEEVFARIQTHVALRKMQIVLQEQKEQLQQANEELERRVEERTAKLAEANKSLRDEIAERKQAEQNLKEALSEIKLLKDQLQADSTYLREEIKLEHNYEEIIGRSTALRYVLFKVEQVANTDTTTLILGETGTGKELIARAIHGGSSRKDRPLVKVNCASLPATLLENELFGHEKGAFTSAAARQIGRFEIANGSTILLDEIGELSSGSQNKLLRVLEDGEFERLGSSRTIKVDVRVLAATNRDLEEEIREGRFRQDLYYRLNVFPITVPPLRERDEDIPLLVTAFLDEFNKKLGKQIEKIPRQVMLTLQKYSWPGNIRELRNVIERAVINSQVNELHMVDRLVSLDTSNLRNSDKKTLETVEREYILEILNEVNWRIEGRKGAAKILDLNPSTLRTRMRKLRISKPKVTHPGFS